MNSTSSLAAPITKTRGLFSSLKPFKEQLIEGNDQ